MDIPDTGAVFTLGKSYLSSEDNNSYFFIKNDAVKHLVAGSYQSAVICESGRLFVWGRNDDGQLGIPNNPQLQQHGTVTRPSCVKAYKSNGIKIKSIAFGDKFSVTISLDNRVHVCGKKIGTDHSDWKPFEIVEFKTLANDKNLNYIDVQAGNEFFIVLTNCGKAYGYGSNEFNQISKSSDTTMYTKVPEKIAISEHIKQIVCHDTKSLYVTDTNEIYVFNRTVANRIEFDDDIIEYLNYNPNNNYVYLICESGSYLSELTAKVKLNDFRKLNLFDDAADDNENPDGNQIQIISFGNDNSLSFTTRNGRFFTNYDRQVRGDEFHEIKKFLCMRIINVSSGDYHILAHALPNLKPLTIINEEMDVRMNVSRSKKSMIPMTVVAPQIPNFANSDKLNEDKEVDKIVEENDNPIDGAVNEKRKSAGSEHGSSQNESDIGKQKDDDVNDQQKIAGSEHGSLGQESAIVKSVDHSADKRNSAGSKPESPQNETATEMPESIIVADKIADVVDDKIKMENWDKTYVMAEEHKISMNDIPKVHDKIKEVKDNTLAKIAIGTTATTLAVGTVAAPLIHSVLKKSDHKVKSTSELKPEMNGNISGETEVDENHNHIPSHVNQNHLEVPEKHLTADHNSTSETDSVSDLSFPGSECTVKFRENPETINSADTNPSIAELEHEISEQDMRSINNAVNLVRVKTFAESKITESTASTKSPTEIDTSAMKIIDTKKNEVYNVIQTRDGQLKQIELVQRRSPDDDENQSTTESNDIRFIDNGIDVTDDIKKTDETKMSARMLRLKNSKVAPADQIPTQHHMEDELLGEKMSSFQMKEVRDSKFETQIKLREQFDSPSGVPPKQRKPKTPMPIKSRHFDDSENNSDDDDDDDDADCRTTASAASTKDPKSTSKKNSISNTSLSMVPAIKKAQSSRDDTIHQSVDADHNDNKVKKFFRNIKDSSCKQIDNIRSADCMNPSCNCMNPEQENQVVMTEATNQIQNSQKNSKICNIL